MKIKRLTFELHNFCSRKCDFCLKKKIKNKKFEFMKDEEFYNIIDILNNSLELFEDKVYIKIYGLQEPLYKSEILKNKIKYLKENFNKNISIIIITNGDFLNKESLNNIIGIDELRVNDYNNEGIKRYLNFCKKLNLIPKTINFKIYNGNHPKEYIDHYDYDKKINIRFYLNTSKNFIVSNLASEHTELLKNNEYKFLNNEVFLRKNKCEVIGNTLNFELNGDIKICPSITNQLNKYKNYTKWNLKNNKIKNILKEINDIEIPFFCLNCDNVGHECLY